MYLMDNYRPTYVIQKNPEPFYKVCVEKNVKVANCIKITAISHQMYLLF